MGQSNFTTNIFKLFINFLSIWYFVECYFGILEKERNVEMILGESVHHITNVNATNDSAESRSEKETENENK